MSCDRFELRDVVLQGKGGDLGFGKVVEVEKGGKKDRKRKRGRLGTYGNRERGRERSGQRKGKRDLDWGGGRKEGNLEQRIVFFINCFIWFILGR